MYGADVINIQVLNTPQNKIIRTQRKRLLDLIKQPFNVCYRIITFISWEAKMYKQTLDGLC